MGSLKIVVALMILDVAPSVGVTIWYAKSRWHDLLICSYLKSFDAEIYFLRFARRTSWSTAISSTRREPSTRHSLTATGQTILTWAILFSRIIVNRSWSICIWLNGFFCSCEDVQQYHHVCFLGLLSGIALKVQVKIHNFQSDNSSFKSNYNNLRTMSRI